MRMMIGALLLATTACAANSANEGGDNSPPAGSGKCDAGPAQSLVGQTASDTLGAEAMRLSKATKLRWIPEGGAVTMDYNPSRLNIQLDRGNKVVTINCG